MATGDIYKFGTLFVNNTKISSPTRPWSTGRQLGSLSELGLGNCYDYKTTGKGSIEIRNSDSDEDYKIKWVEINFPSYKLFICDRNILSNVCYDDLDLYGLINKNISIDGKQYTLRLLDGGYSTRINGDSYSGANPRFNEWDSIIRNELNFEGLPVGRPEDDVNTLPTLDEFNAPLNKLWNCVEMNSHCYNFSGAHPTTGTKTNTLRGLRRNAKYFTSYNRDIPLPSFGYRPVLELKKEITLLPDDAPLNVVKNEINDISKGTYHNHSKLYATIKEKGVELTATDDKTSDLINKVKTEMVNREILRDYVYDGRLKEYTENQIPTITGGWNWGTSGWFDSNSIYTINKNFQVYNSSLGANVIRTEFKTCYYMRTVKTIDVTKYKKMYALVELLLPSNPGNYFEYGMFLTAQKTNYTQTTPVAIFKSSIISAKKSFIVLELNISNVNGSYAPCVFIGNKASTDNGVSCSYDVHRVWFETIE